jgi:hypothetical protein
MKKFIVAFIVAASLVAGEGFAASPGFVITPGRVTNPTAAQIIAASPATPNPGSGSIGIWYWYKVDLVNFTAAAVAFDIQLYSGAAVVATVPMIVPASTQDQWNTGVMIQVPIGYYVRVTTPSAVTGQVAATIAYESGSAY